LNGKTILNNYVVVINRFNLREIIVEIFLDVRRKKEYYFHAISIFTTIKTLALVYEPNFRNNERYGYFITLTMKAIIIVATKRIVAATTY